MGLMLSILVVCVGVLEAVSCFRHIQNGYLPFWLPNRLRPMITEPMRRTPSAEDDDSSSSEEVSRILIDGLGKSSSHDASYGLTPILTEHRRNTPILRDEEIEGEATKYVENNIDESFENSSLASSNVISELFRPISPSADLEVVGDDSASISSEKFVEIEASPIDDRQSCTSERLLLPLVENDHTFSYKTPTVECDAQSLNYVGVSLKTILTPTTNEAVAEVETSVGNAPNVDAVDVIIDSPNITPRNNELVDRTVNDIFLENSPQENDTPYPIYPPPSSDVDTNDTDSNSSNSLIESLINLDAELPVFHRPPLNFEPSLGSGSTSRPITPGTPRKTKADISWPVFHPDVPVIKRPSVSSEYVKSLSRTSMSRDDSIDEDLVLEDLAVDQEDEDKKTESQVDNSLVDLKDLSKPISEPQQDLVLSEPSVPEVSSGCPIPLQLSEISHASPLPPLNSSLSSLEDFIPKKESTQQVSAPDSTITAVSDNPATSGRFPTDLTTDQSSFNTSSQGAALDSTQPTNNLVHSPADLSKVTTNDTPVFPDTRTISPQAKFSDLDFDLIDDYFSQTAISASTALPTGIYAQPRQYIQIGSDDNVQKVPEPCDATVDDFVLLPEDPVSEERLRSIESMIESSFDVVEKPFSKTVTKDRDRMVSLADILCEPECQKRAMYTVSTDTNIEPECSVSSQIELSSGNDRMVELDVVAVEITPNVIESECALVSKYEVTSENEIKAKAECIFGVVPQETTENTSKDVALVENAVSKPECDGKYEVTSENMSEAELESISDKVPQETSKNNSKDVTINEDSVVEPELISNFRPQKTPENASESVPIEPEFTRASQCSVASESESKIEPECISNLVAQDTAQNTSENIPIHADMVSKSVNEMSEDEPQIMPKDSTLDAAMHTDNESVPDMCTEIVASLLQNIPDDVIDGSGFGTGIVGTSFNADKDVEDPSCCVNTDVGNITESTVSKKLVTDGTTSEDIVEHGIPDLNLDSESMVGLGSPEHDKETPSTTIPTEEVVPSLASGPGEVLKDSVLEPECVITVTSALTSSSESIGIVPQKSVDSVEGLSVDDAGYDDSSESISLGKDITSKESSIKRRKSYRDKKRNTTPKSSTEKIPEELKDAGRSVNAKDEGSAGIEGNAIMGKDFGNLLNALSCDDCATGGVEKEIAPVVVLRTKPARSTDEVEEIVHRRESATEAILNKDLRPIETLQCSETNVESAVFATKREEPKKRLKKPARTESFEEANYDPTKLEKQIPSRNSERGSSSSVTDRRTSVEQIATIPEPNKPEIEDSEAQKVVGGTVETSSSERLPERADPNTVDDSVSQKVSSDSSAVSKSNDTNDDEDDDTGAECSASESEASRVKEPVQASNPAFWLIFSGEYTKAMSKDWHSGHFCCWQCDESLTGQRYVLRDDHPYCIKCYESVFANMCEECNKTIGIDSKDLSYKDKHWHEACFLCNKCRVSLVDKQFGSKADKIYCGNCYDSQFASRCDGCGEIFRAGTKKMEYKTRQWHEKCFCCCVCKSAIGTKSFIPREQEIYCATCYEEKFATRCVKCNKIITSGGVTYKNEPWHRECFTCTHCSTSLAGQRFTSRDEKPYCADCFGELFAKRCTACVKPITGIGGTRFISFEDRHWHNDCFICATCKTSLVGRGFITDADDIICPECAKQKLM